MPSTTADATAKLTPRQRLGRGLTHTATGPVDLTRAAVGLGAQSARSGAAHLRRRYQAGRLAREVAAAVQSAPAQRRGRRSRALAAATTALLMAGGAAVVMIRRPSRPDEPSSRPPSVAVQPKP